MDRHVAFTGQIPLSENFNAPERNTMVALAKLSEAVFGTAQTIDGLDVAPTSPASMAVRVAPGQIYQQAALDALAFGELPADTAHQIVKQGIMMDPLTIQISAPGTPGFSQWFLIQCAFQEQEGGAVVLPYYNSANPSQAYAGPGNSGEQQYTQRLGRIVFQTKAGSPAATGSQPVPQPDPGWMALAWVGVANGQTSIQSQHIVPAAARRRSVLKLPDIGLSIGHRATRVTANRNLTVDDMGLVVADLGAFSGSITLTLPPANSLGNGVPLRCKIIGRHLTPVTQATRGSNAVIVPTAGNTLDLGLIWIGYTDSVDLISDGSNGWYWVSQKTSAHCDLILTAEQTIPTNVDTAVIFQIAEQSQPYWSAANPTAITAIAPMRVRLQAGVSFSANATGIRHARIILNSTAGGYGMGRETTLAAPGTDTDMTLAGAPIAIFPGDYLQLIVWQNSGIPLTLRPFTTWMTLEPVE